MKPDCRRVLSQIASYSVEELSPSDVDAFTRHLDDCPPCKGQWLLFEKTLTTLSQVGEAELSVQQEQQMWLTCLEHVKKKPLAGAADLSHEVEVLPHPFRSDSSQREGDRRSDSFSSAPRVSSGNPNTPGSESALRGQSTLSGEASRGSGRAIGRGTGNSGWIDQLSRVLSPSWGYALAGGAAAVFAASLFASPTPSPVAPPRAVAALPMVPANSAAERALVSFQQPPHATTGMIDYHAAMAFEPFSDHVAPTLVSYTATQP